MKNFVYAFAVALSALVAGQAWATPAWYQITFTGADMFNYTTGIAPYASQSARAGSVRTTTTTTYKPS